jgi:hypothetical protein
MAKGVPEGDLSHWKEISREGDMERVGAGDIADAGTEVRALSLRRPRTPKLSRSGSRLASSSWLGEEMERKRRV